MDSVHALNLIWSVMHVTLNWSTMESHYNESLGEAEKIPYNRNALYITEINILT